MRIGYALVCEEHGPDELVRNAKLAEELGFDYVSISDHFHPWSTEQGQSPFAWTVIGALRAVTDLPVVTQVTCPIRRYHPAIVAQAAATSAAMGSADFVLGLGTGEALNENIVGDTWPAPQIRLDMLEEAIEIIRALWTGDPVTHYGTYFKVDRATLYTLPARVPDIAVAASGGRSMQVAASNGSLITTAPDPDTVSSYRDAGGADEVFGQASVCYGKTQEDAEATMLRYWRHSPLGWDVKSDLATPGSFEEATADLPDDAVLGSEPIGPDVDAIAASIDEYRQAGFDAVSLHNVGPDQETFLRAVGPRLFS